jgi:formylglycine-generating enzyme required for sulfatase activity
MGRFAHDDIEAAAKQLGKLPQHGSRIRVAGVSLPVPEEVRSQQVATLSRRRLLRWLGWGALGLGATVGAGSLLRHQFSERFPELPAGGAPRDVTLEPFAFDVVTVDGQGNISNREQRQARQFIETLGDGVTLEMVSIPGGNFIMGAPEGEKGSDDTERPQHPVDVPPFFLGKYPVTQAQWAAVAALPKVSRDLERNPSHFQGADRPVETITWYDAMEFCARLSQLTGTRYRLPSEAEWEYACRAGTTTPFHFGETITAELANYNGSVTYGDEPEGTYRQETTPVGSFQVANAFGLYDMHGLVWEWCADPWHENYEGAPSDGSVWESEGNDNDNRSRLLRGGSWDDDPVSCRSADRNLVSPDDWLDTYGFRVVCAWA